MIREIKKQIIEIINNIDDVNILNFIYLYLSKIKNELEQNQEKKEVLVKVKDA